MKQTFIAVLFILAGAGNIQAQNTMGPAERRMTDSLCNALSKVDVNKITSKEEANSIFTDCFSRYTSLLMEVAEERKIDFSDDAAMEGLGTDIGKDLLKLNCGSFLKLAAKMAGSKNNAESKSTTSGTFKRIENKGLNYIVITDPQGKEKSFIWLRQFTGSERFTSGTTALVGKKLKVTWQDMEVYLPQAKGYYNVKEITAIDIL
ncbi:hypothetical protein KHS38_06065 [Mucilaginibacter sp. Bleaf8]|uniref:hypothetical protein n=1 Tax=Mucilaginibacter sp. Bleaf8 TaxID=2834430 RepID=UPI001BD0E7C7|nr:hypothetical protein [Mucilaginibacter sp. Bleaf8]MBS7563964.1 hypothetical protein [Mucilaginibacter sp. Bleaf8]